MKIAMLLDAAGRAVRPEANGTVYVYERQGNDWIVSRSRSHSAADCTTIAGMRAYLTETCQWLDDCTVLAAQSPRGFAQLVLAQNGVDFWAIDGLPKNYLDQIAAAYGRPRVEAVAAMKVAAR
jgi:hypothetical protein